VILLDAKVLLYAYLARSEHRAAQVLGALTSDAHLAALAIEHGATLCTCDRDFTRFPGLRILNPLSL